MVDEGSLTHAEMKRFCEAVARKVAKNPELVRKDPQDKYLFVEVQAAEGIRQEVVLRVFPCGETSEVSLHAGSQRIWRATREWRRNDDEERVFQDLSKAMAKAALHTQGRFERQATRDAAQAMRQMIVGAPGDESAVEVAGACQVTKLTTAVRAFVAAHKRHRQTNTDAIRARFFEVLDSVRVHGWDYDEVIPGSASDWSIEEVDEVDVGANNVEAICHEMSGYLYLAMASILGANSDEQAEIGDYLSGKITSFP